MKDPQTKTSWTGLQLVTLGVVLQLVGMGFASSMDDDSIWQISLTWIILIASLFPYLKGYMRAVKEKSYSPFLFLAAFTGFIGTILIYILPDQSSRIDTEDESQNKPQ